MEFFEDNSDIDIDDYDVIEVDEEENDEDVDDSEDDDDDDDDDTGESEDDSEGYFHDYDYPNSTERDKLRRNDPRMRSVKMCGHLQLRDITELGICLQGNTHVRHLDLCFTISDWYKLKKASSIEIRLALDDAFQGFYDFVESCPVLTRLKMDLGKNNYLEVVDNFLYRISRRAHKNPCLPGVQRVILKECVFSPAALTCLLRSEHLKHLRLSFRTANIPYFDVQAWQKASQALSQNESLESLVISGYFAAILPGPHQNPSMLQVLTLRGYYHEDDDENNRHCIENIIQFLQHAPNLRVVSLWKSMAKHFTDIAGSALASPRCTVTELDVFCTLDVRGRVGLIKLLQSTPRIHELQVAATDATWDAALRGLMENHSVEGAAFYRAAKVEDNHDCNLSRSLTRLLELQHPTLRSLKFQDLKNTHAAALFRALAKNTSLTSLDIKLEASLDDDTSSAMQQLFTGNKTLTRFELRCEFKSISPLRVLFEAVKCTRARTILFLYESHDAPPALETACSLCSLTAALMEESGSLAELHIYRRKAAICACTAACVTANIRAVPRNRSLEELGFGWIQTSDDAILNLQVDEWMDILPRIVSLKKLFVGLTNTIVRERKDELLRAVSRNCCLEDLDCNSCSSLFRSQCKVYFTRNKERRTFVVKSGSDDAAPTPPGLLARVLATAREQPYGATVIYEVLRRNVHAVGLSS